MNKIIEDTLIFRKYFSKMAPPKNNTSVKKEVNSVKRGTVGKLTTEVRKRVPDTKALKQNYYVNKAKQINKIFIKNQSAAPLSYLLKNSSILRCKILTNQ